MKTFKKLFFIENKFYDLFYFRNKYGKDIESALLRQQVIKHKERGKYIVFNFVGVTIYESFIICVLPKYLKSLDLDGNEKIAIFSKVINVIKKYDKENKTNLDIIMEKNNENYLSILQVVDFLLNDYSMNGYITYFYEEFSLEGEGQIEWQKTTDLSYAYIIDKTPHYFELYKIQKNEEIFSLITKIHKVVIHECINKFSSIMGYNLENTYYDNDFYFLNEIGDKNTILATLKNRLVLAYNDREIILLKNLIIFIENYYNASEVDDYVYGTTDFEFIWEEVCKQVFNHQPYRHMPRNFWKSYQNKFIKEESKQKLIPDLIVKVTHNNQKTLILADAKYYNIAFDPSTNTVKGTPGIGDTSKQFLYKKALTQANIDINKFFNLFLFPAYSLDNFEVIGEVSINHPMVGDVLKNDSLFKLQPVQLVLVSTEYIYEKYLNDFKFTPKEINLLLDLLVGFRKMGKRI